MLQPTALMTRRARIVGRRATLLVTAITTRYATCAIYRVTLLGSAQRETRWMREAVGPVEEAAAAVVVVVAVIGILCVGTASRWVI